MLEPITSVLLVGYLACSPAATRKPDYFNAAQKEVVLGDCFSELETRYTITEDFYPVTNYLILPQLVGQFHYDDHLESISNEIDSYSLLEDGWDGEDSFKPSNANLERAKLLLGKLPSGIPNPTPMLSKSGDLGFYWNNEDFYADLHLESELSISLYVRKKTDKLNEYFFDNLPEASLTSNWIKENVNILYSA